MREPSFDFDLINHHVSYNEMGEYETYLNPSGLPVFTTNNEVLMSTRVSDDASLIVSQTTGNPNDLIYWKNNFFFPNSIEKIPLLQLYERVKP